MVYKKRGQISFEYLVIVGFVTLVISAVLAISLIYTNTVQDRVKVNNLESFGDKIISTSEHVFYSGAPSKATITAYLPGDVVEIEVAENTLFVSIWTSSGLNKIGYPSNVNLANVAPGSFNTNEGLKKFEIVAGDTEVTIIPV